MAIVQRRRPAAIQALSRLGMPNKKIAQATWRTQRLMVQLFAFRSG